MGKTNLFVFVSIVSMTMAGCTSINNNGCGEGYEEMYGGYEYGFNSTSIDAQNSLQVKVEIVKGGGGWWLEGVGNIPRKPDLMGRYYGEILRWYNRRNKLQTIELEQFRGWRFGFIMEQNCHLQQSRWIL